MPLICVCTTTLTCNQDPSFEHFLGRLCVVVWGQVVADVARYQEFLPYCCSSTILRRRGDCEFDAELAIGFNAFQEKYTSKYALVNPRTPLLPPPRACMTLVGNIWTGRSLLRPRAQLLQCLKVGERGSELLQAFPESPSCSCIQPRSRYLLVDACTPGWVADFQPHTANGSRWRRVGRRVTLDPSTRTVHPTLVASDVFSSLNSTWRLKPGGAANTCR